VGHPPQPTDPNPTRRQGGRPLTGHQLDWIVRRTLTDAGLGDRIPDGAVTQAMRHTFATVLAAGGADVATLADILGHANITTTQMYISSTDQRRRAAITSNPHLDALG
jgi:integrase/recombinase XerD